MEGAAPGRVTAMAAAAEAYSMAQVTLRPPKTPDRKKPVYVSLAAVVSTARTGMAACRICSLPRA